MGGVIYWMSSKMQASQAVLRLGQIGVEARLLPGRPGDVRGQWLEVDAAEGERAAAHQIICWVDPGAQDMGPVD